MCLWILSLLPLLRDGDLTGEGKAKEKTPLCQNDSPFEAILEDGEVFKY